jgi:preprotein translocase subunit SecG
MTILLPILLTIHIAVSLLMVVSVLMQRPRSEGLGAAFGGGMTDNLFGAQTTHVLAKFTTWLGITFFALTLILAMVYSRLGQGETRIQKELLSMPVPAAAAASPSPAAGSVTVSEVIGDTPAQPAVSPAAPADVAPTEATPLDAASPAPATPAN